MLFQANQAIYGLFKLPLPVAEGAVIDLVKIDDNVHVQVKKETIAVFPEQAFSLHNTSLFHAQSTFTAFYKEGHIEVPRAVLLEKRGEEVHILENNCTIEVCRLDAFVENGRNLFINRKTFRGIVTKSGILIIRYVNLHGHSEYSLLDGMIRINDLVDKTEWAAALTDHGNMFGSLQFYKSMLKAGKKPILGFEAYCASHPYTELIQELTVLDDLLKAHVTTREQFFIDNPDVQILIEDTIEYVSPMQTVLFGDARRAHHLVLLAKNNKGIQNLFKLTSYGYQHFYKRPQITWEKLEEHAEGLIVLSACMAGEIPRAILKEDFTQASFLIEEMQRLFGDDFYLEIQRHGLLEEMKVEKGVMKLAKKHSVKVVATTDAHYLNKNDKYYHDIQLCIGQKDMVMDDPSRWELKGEGYHIHSSLQMVERFADRLDALDTSLDIAEKIDFTLDLETLHLPKFPIPAPYKDDMSYLRVVAEEGFRRRFNGTAEYTDPIYLERLAFELDTIEKMGFPGYFLIVWDFVKYAKDHDILVGPGRGSACGSLLTYCLDITNINPIKFDLLFERFLNPDRISMPDIDIDFPDTRRHEVLKYVREKYGDESVSGVITFSKLLAKSVTRDVSRVLGYKPELGNRISKLIPNKLEVDGKNMKLTLPNLIKYVPELKTLYETDDDVRKVIDIARHLEGLPKSASQHACATIIAPTAVSDYIPQAVLKNSKTKEAEIVTQYQMGECEDRGLLKMDFLGCAIR